MKTTLDDLIIFEDIKINEEEKKFNERQNFLYLYDEKHDIMVKNKNDEKKVVIEIKLY
tara:strand:- start:778 stop:951 length:174 start_codon:yes stop_codon:yes gene_type:complete